MAFSIPNGTVVQPITIRWVDEHGEEHRTDFWAELRPEGRMVDNVPVLEVDVRPYIHHEEMRGLEGREDQEEESIGSVNQSEEDPTEEEEEEEPLIVNMSPIKKRMKISGDPGDEQLPKRMRRGPYPSCQECLEMGFNYPDEGPSERWCIGDPGPQDEAEIELTDESGEGSDEDQDYNNEDDDFLDDSDDDDSHDFNDFFMDWNTDPTYTPGTRALNEWDSDFRRT